MSKYDTTFFQYFQNIKRQIQVSPLNLGGTAVSSGGPPGGFTGWLPQNRVGYDVAEVALSGFASPSAYNPSGILVNASLLDNMNHIRYRLAIVEALAFGGNYISVYDDSVPVASGVTILNFGSGASVALTAPTEVTITVTASGSGADEKAKVSSDDSTADYLENQLTAGTGITIATLNPGGNESVQISSSVINTDINTKVSSNDTTTNYLENKLSAGSNITLNVLNEGGNEQIQIASTASGGGSSSFTGLTDTPSSYAGQSLKGLRVNSGETALEFVTLSGGGSALEAPFVGAKAYLTSNDQLSTSTGWQDISWDTTEYESDDNMWISGTSINFQEDGYYSVIAQATISGAIPTTERIQLGLFKNVSTFVVGIYDGYYTSANGARTLQLLYQGNFAYADNVKVALLNGAGTQPYVLSGVANTFLAVHKIHGAVQAQIEDPKIVSLQLSSGYISANNETETPITWNAEVFDTDTMWSSGSQIQINTAGYYHVDASCVWEDLNNQGDVPFQVKIGIRLSGTTILAQKWEWHDVDTNGARSDALSTPISCDTPYLDTDDYLEVVVYHSKGSTASNIIRSPGYNTYCMIHKIQ